MPRSEKSHPCRKTCQGTAILMSGQSLNDRCELQKLTAVFLEEAVELQRMIGIIAFTTAIAFHSTRVSSAV